MKYTVPCRYSLLITIFLLTLSMSSCFTAGKMNKNIAAYYGNEIPKISKKKAPQITITSSLPLNATQIATTTHQMKMLPLIVYWSYDDRLNSTLNPQIAFNNFNNTVIRLSSKELIGKLNGRRIELSLDQIPRCFALSDKGKVILLLIRWQQVSVIPVAKDMKVSYKLYRGDDVEKTGTIIVEDSQNNSPLGFFQTIKSGTSQYLDYYTGHISNLTQQMLAELTKEL